MSFAGLIALVLLGASPGAQDFDGPPPIQNCATPPAEKARFTAAVTIDVDMHGAAGELMQCPEIEFGIDFSKIDLDHDYPDLRKQIGISSVVTRQPIDMTVRGYFATDPKTSRRILFLTHINSWRTHGPAIPLPARN